MLLSRARMPTLQELIAFEAAGRHGSFTRAAEELALTQSAVSKQVRQLEDALGGVLFSRAKGRVTLTALGEQYLRSVRRILSDYETSAHAVIAAGGSEASLKIAVLPTFASRWLIPRLPTFLAQHPAVTINVVTEIKPFDFADRPADVAIHYGDPTWPHAEAIFICDEIIIAVASPGYAERHGLEEAENLARATLLQQGTRPNLWQQWLDAAGVKHPFPYRGPMFDQFSMAIQAAAVGLGVALTPGFLVESELKAGQLLRLNAPPLPGAGAYYAVIPLRNYQDPLVGKFVSWLVEAARESEMALA